MNCFFKLRLGSFTIFLLLYLHTFLTSFVIYIFYYLVKSLNEPKLDLSLCSILIKRKLGYAV